MKLQQKVESLRKSMCADLDGFDRLIKLFYVFNQGLALDKMV